MYGKLFRQMYHGTLATVGPWQALITFQQLIVLADQDGTVDMTPEAIARETTVPLEIIRIGIEALEKPDPDSRSPDEEGRRIVRLAEHRKWGWRVVNYEHYRRVKREEDRREYHRQYWQKRKAKVSTPLNTTQHTQPNQPIAYAEAYAEAVKSKRERAPVGARLPPDFALTPERRAFAESQTADPELQFAQFRDYWTAATGKGSTKRDWDAAWRTGCRNAANFERRSTRNGSSVAHLKWRPTE